MFLKNLVYDSEHRKQFDRLIVNWEPSSDTWSLKYSKYALPGFGSLTAYWTTMYLRKAAKMGNVARLTTLSLPLYSTVFCGMFHTFLVEHPLISGREYCSLCAASRSAVIQSLFGSIVPTVTAGLTVAFFAGASNSYAFHDKMFTNWPAMKTNASIILNLFKKRRHDRTVVALFVANLLFGYLIGYLQYNSIIKITTRLYHEGKSSLITPEQWDPFPGIKV